MALLVRLLLEQLSTEPEALRGEIRLGFEKGADFHVVVDRCIDVPLASEIRPSSIMARARRFVEVWVALAMGLRSFKASSYSFFSKSPTAIP
jgi:hypothetical protein